VDVVEIILPKFYTDNIKKFDTNKMNFSYNKMNRTNPMQQYASQYSSQHASQQQQPIYYICTMPPNGFNFPLFPPPDFIEQNRAAKRSTEEFLNEHREHRENREHREHREQPQSLKKARIEIVNDGEVIKQRFKSFKKLETTTEDFENLMNYIINDMDLTMSVIAMKDQLFAPFERTPGETLKLVNNIKAYALELNTKNLRFCKYKDECRCRETCSFIHDKAYQSIIETFAYFQYSGNKFIDNPWSVSASFINKNLNELENDLWCLKSRINYKY